ncbi:MAG: bifunctional oligoribonuclease/PAP phosphatase NrnA [Bacillota bacterium]
MITDNRGQMDRLFSAIRAARSVCVFPHIDPDGDALGSALALRSLITRLGKPAKVVLDGQPPERLSFMPGFDTICDAASVKPCENTLAVSVDVSSIERLGLATALFNHAAVTAQIDHHETNPGFAQINIIDTKAPSSASVVFGLFKALDLSLREGEATNLYIGLSTDTGNFQFKNTDANSFRIMAELMEAGLNISHYSRLLFLRKEREHIALLGKALPTFRYAAGGKVAGMYIDYKTMREIDPAGEHCEGIVNYAINTKGVRLAYLVREAPRNAVKCSLRALPPYRVDEVALQHGGGGHRLAAGCTLHMPLMEAADTIEAELVKACAEADALAK